MAVAKAVALLPAQNKYVRASSGLTKITNRFEERSASLQWQGSRWSGSSASRRCDATIASLLKAKARAGLAIVDEDGSCSCCGARLNLIRLTEAQRAAVRRELLTRSAPRNPQKQHRLISFSQWLSNRAPFDYVLDGPNLAYAKQNFEGGKFRFEHLDAIVRHLQGRQKRVLVLLPNKYLTGSDIPNRTSSSKRSSKMTDADRALITDWQRQGILYSCAPDLYDDWFWMYASVAEGAAAEKSVVVTNDAMRDHWNNLLPQHDFSRWRASQIVSFDVHYATVSGIEGDGELLLQNVEVQKLPVFSVEAQLIDGRWHVPIAGSNPQHWLCIPEIIDRCTRG